MRRSLIGILATVIVLWGSQVAHGTEPSMDPPAPEESPPVWKNPFALNMHFQGGLDQGSGITANWFFHRFFGVSGRLTVHDLTFRIRGSLLGSAHVRINSAMVIGLNAGGLMGKALILEDESLMEESGFYFSAGPFLLIRFPNGLQTGIRILKHYVLYSREDRSFGSDVGTTYGLFVGFAFSGPFSEIQAKEGEMSLAGSIFNVYHFADPVVEHRPWSVLFGLGTGTPAGHLFAEAGYNPWPHWNLAVAGGIGSDGPALSTTIRYLSMNPGAANHLFIGSGLAWGTLGESVFSSAHPNEEEFVIRNALFANIETGYGWVSGGGMILRLTMGLSIPLNLSRGTCVKNCTHVSIGGEEISTRETGSFQDAYIYVSLALGFTL